VPILNQVPSNRRFVKPGKSDMDKVKEQLSRFSNAEKAKPAYMKELRDLYRRAFDSPEGRSDVRMRLAWEKGNWVPLFLRCKMFIQCVNKQATLGAYREAHPFKFPQSVGTWGALTQGYTDEEIFEAFLNTVKEESRKAEPRDPCLITQGEMSAVVKVGLKDDNYSAKKVEKKKWRTIQILPFYVNMCTYIFGAGVTEYMYKHDISALGSNPTNPMEWARSLPARALECAEKKETFATFALDATGFDGTFPQEEITCMTDNESGYPEDARKVVNYALTQAPFSVGGEMVNRTGCGGNLSGSEKTVTVNEAKSITLLTLCTKRVNDLLGKAEGSVKEGKEVEGPLAQVSKEFYSYRMKYKDSRAAGDDTITFVRHPELVDFVMSEFMSVYRENGIEAREEDKVIANEKNAFTMSVFLSYRTIVANSLPIPFVNDLERRLTRFNTANQSTESLQGVVDSLASTLYLAHRGFPVVDRLELLDKAMQMYPELNWHPDFLQGLDLRVGEEPLAVVRVPQDVVE
jgi:hypothetical protein